MSPAPFRGWAIAVASAAIGLFAACGDDDHFALIIDPATEVPDASYILRALDGQPLPAPATSRSFGVQTVVADTLVFMAGNTFTQWTVPDTGTPVLGVVGTFERRGDSLFLFEQVLGSLAAAGSYSGDTLRLRSMLGHQFPDHDWLYVWQL